MYPSNKDPFNTNQIPLEKILNGKNEKIIKNYFDTYEYTHTSILLGEKTTTNQASATSSKNYGYPILIEIESGAKFVSIIDICITGLSGEGVKNYYAFIEQMIADNSALIPINISHIVTSNIIDLKDIVALTGKIAYADALLLPDVDLVSSSFLELDEEIKKAYPSMYKKDMEIHNPPFGSNLNIYVCQKYQLKPIHESHPLAEKIKEHNINVIYGLNMQNIPIFKEQIYQCKNNISVVVDVKNIIENYYPVDMPEDFYHLISALEIAIPKKDFIFILQNLLNDFIKNLQNKMKDNLNPELVRELQQRIAPTDALQKYNPSIQIN